jgi:peptidoglycan/xylan/chitin deacetylase (PgdA/CDA1 family)
MNKIKILLALIFVFTFLSANSQDKKICITVDDLPVVPYGIEDPDFQMQLIKNLIRTFDTYHIPAIGYVNEIKLFQDEIPDSAQLNLLVQWVNGGYDLGNHTYSHHSYNKVPDSVYFDDILKGQIITSQLMEAQGKKLQYFRHPYLHAGRDAEKYEALNAFLTKHNYIPAPVTIDNDDYLFAKAYHNAYQEGNKKLMVEIGEQYVTYMEEKVLFFEQKSKEVFGRNIAQTLLIHASLLNSEYLDELAEMLVKNGYTFISQEETLNDTAYSTPVTSYTEYGYSWIYRWGFSMGFTNTLRKGDIEVPGMIAEMAGK